MSNEIPLTRGQWTQNREADRLAAQAEKLRAENERLRAAVVEIWAQVAPGAYDGVNYSAQIGRIKGICMVLRAALAGKEAPGE